MDAVWPELVEAVYGPCLEGKAPKRGSRSPAAGDEDLEPALRAAALVLAAAEVHPLALDAKTRRAGEVSMMGLYKRDVADADCPGRRPRRAPSRRVLAS